jgi:hypothetical protein
MKVRSRLNLAGQRVVREQLGVYPAVAAAIIS